MGIRAVLAEIGSGWYYLCLVTRTGMFVKLGIVVSQIVRGAVLDTFKPTGINLNLRNHFSFEA